ncbi:hypothetical protein E2C01_091306 [Portunus trituberculatus]|uniref:Uncharacterized protein n=1 Tax=Portunus trituberculatus TaxID=210409 RepID=A0A5B7JML8_PORTR|nr:hypothetical protein [Portunus trituberculatus]
MKTCHGTEGVKKIMDVWRVTALDANLTSSQWPLFNLLPGGEQSGGKKRGCEERRRKDEEEEEGGYVCVGGEVKHVY